MKRDEIKVGMLVDYHSVIGGPVTTPALVVCAGPQWTGGCWVVWLEGTPGCAAIEACTPALPFPAAPLAAGTCCPDCGVYQLRHRDAPLLETHNPGCPRAPGTAAPPAAPPALESAPADDCERNIWQVAEWALRHAPDEIGLCAARILGVAPPAPAPEGVSKGQLKEWERLADVATPGPWSIDERPLGGGCVSALIGGAERQVASATGQAATYDASGRDVTEVQTANGRFIAAARAAFPLLLTEVRRLRAENLRLWQIIPPTYSAPAVSAPGPVVPLEIAAASAPAAPEPPPCRTCGEGRDSLVHIMEHIYRPVKGDRDGR